MKYTLFTTETGYRWVPGYEGRYMCNDRGDVASFVYKRQGKMMKNTMRPDGYSYVRLWKDSVCKLQYTHRLVYMTHVGAIGDKLEINHIDSDPSNNTRNNLELVTSAQNTQHSLKHGNMNTGEKHHSSKVTDYDRHLIYDAHKKGNTQVFIATMFGLSQQGISKIIKKEKIHEIHTIHNG